MCKLMLYEKIKMPKGGFMKYRGNTARIASVFVILALILAPKVSAKGQEGSKTVILGGMPFGVSFKTGELKVGGFDDVETESGTRSPAKEAGLLKDDIIKKVDFLRKGKEIGLLEGLLNTCKDRMRSYKLPVITDNYFVELSEANEAILEVIKELDKKPIVIKVLNTRVDTARDLVLKLYNTTMDMVRTANLAEMAIVYVNRYRSKYEDVDRELTDAEKAFYKGNYKESLDITIKVTSKVNENVYRKLMSIYEK